MSDWAVDMTHWSGRRESQATAHAAPLFADRRTAGRALAALLRAEVGPTTRVYGVDRGGVPVAAEVASRMHAPLDALALGRIAHPHHPETTLGALAAGGPPAIDPRQGWLSPAARTALDPRVADAEHEARELDERLHQLVPSLDPEGSACVLVTDALIGGTPAIAACRWAAVHGARETVVAAPAATVRAIREIGPECTAVRCSVVRDELSGVSVWGHERAQLSTSALAELIAEHRRGPATEWSKP